MKFTRLAAIAAIGFATEACTQDNSDNVMSPQANALTPAEVNEALGPEDANATDLNMAANELNGVGNSVANSPAATDSAANNAE